ncbi:FecR domain-containing protein [Chitinophaga filiformis]|uniref:FecR domain-containing protein n=1 Tax=Chitinophaga filiformis TaxID=104663 RepID=UPI001F1F8C84|nr:FecR domain-containing protein [Chitinophaga filiformis]MCF6404385.1 FecR domain-containing protein [Chitinophaga filiformis]
MSYNEEHIFQLILEKLSGDISDEDNQYLEQAAREDPNVRRCLEELEGARDVAGPDFMNDLHNERAWSSVLSLLHADQEKKPNLTLVTADDTPVVNMQDPSSMPNGRNRWWLAAAVTLLLIAAGGYWLLRDRSAIPHNAIAINTGDIPVWGDMKLLLDNGDTIRLSGQAGADINTKEALLHPGAGLLSFTAGKQRKGWNTLFVPTGKDYKVVLSDGSTVHLNAFSRLRFPFSFDGKTREVYLEGEAYFDIAANASQPFIVHTAQTSVRVLGTAFNVNAYADSMVVTSLVQGSVMTKVEEDEGVVLKPGTESIYRKGYSQQTGIFDEAITLAWRKGEYVYYNKPLGTLDAILFHWYGKQLSFEDPLLANKMLTGVIERNQPVTDFLESLDKTSGITYRITDDKIYLRSK